MGKKLNKILCFVGFHDWEIVLESCFCKDKVCLRCHKVSLGYTERLADKNYRTMKANELINEYKNNLMNEKE